MYSSLSDPPLVSVVVPFFRAGAGTSPALSRLKTLTYPNLEMLLVDDGSGDDTVSYLDAFAASDSRAQVVKLQQNVGPGPARNAGLAEAKGAYVWFVDWDDDWQPEILDRLVTTAVSHAADIVACRAVWKGQGGGRAPRGYTDGASKLTLLNRAEAIDFLLVGTIKGYLWNKLFRRDILGEDPFPPMRTQEDVVAVAKAIGVSNTIVCVPEVLYGHVVRDGSLTNSFSPDLNTLTVARNLVHEVARAAMGPSRERGLKLLRYDYSEWLLARANTAIRLSPDAQARDELAAVRRRMRTQDVLRLIVAAPPVGLEALLLKTLGSYYPSGRRLLRSFLRSIRYLPRGTGWAGQTATSSRIRPSGGGR